MNASQQYFPVVLFIMLYRVVLTLKSVDEILKCDHQRLKKYIPMVPFRMLKLSGSAF